MQALRRVHRHLQADGRGARRRDAADPLRGPDRRHRAQRQARASTPSSRTCSSDAQRRGAARDQEEVRRHRRHPGGRAAHRRHRPATWCDHYIDNILPDGFKAQVVCHSKLAAVRYQTAIRQALAARLEREKLQPEPDARADPAPRVPQGGGRDLVRRHQRAGVRSPRRARRRERWNAVENFCKPFDFDDPDKELTGIAFLIVCDMLLTGFDAPIEQVMYIDKKLREHNLLQAIARVNRVAQRQAARLHRRLHRPRQPSDRCALDLLATRTRRTSSEGLKNIAQRAAHPRGALSAAAAALPDAGVRRHRGLRPGPACRRPTPRWPWSTRRSARMKDIKRRADFEVYLKKFLQSLNLSCRNERATPTGCRRGASATCCGWSRSATRTTRSTSPTPARR